MSAHRQCCCGEGCIWCTGGTAPASLRLVISGISGCCQLVDSSFYDLQLTSIDGTYDFGTKLSGCIYGGDEGNVQAYPASSSCTPTSGYAQFTPHIVVVFGDDMISCAVSVNIAYGFFGGYIQVEIFRGSVALSSPYDCEATYELENDYTACTATGAFGTVTAGDIIGYGGTITISPTP